MREGLLHQLLFLLEPIGFVWVSLFVLTVALWWKRQRPFAVASAALFLFITIIGSSGLPSQLLAGLERPYAGVKLEDLPPADAIVLLGGGSTPSRYEAAQVHLTPAGDRIVMTRAVFQLGKAPVLLLGGNANELDGTLRLESELVRDLLASWGVPPGAMIPLGANQDTHDEALKVGALAKERGWKHVLLVTSANHMRRASAVVRAQGLEVTPVPCNFLTTIGTAPAKPGFNVPRYEGFEKVATWLHEEVGWLMYRRRGWIPAE